MRSMYFQRKSVIQCFATKSITCNMYRRRKICNTTFPKGIVPTHSEWYAEIQNTHYKKHSVGTQKLLSNTIVLVHKSYKRNGTDPFWMVHLNSNCKKHSVGTQKFLYKSIFLVHSTYKLHTTLSHKKVS